MDSHGETCRNKKSRDVDFSESESEENETGKPVAYKRASEKPCASSKSDRREVQKLPRQNGHTIYACLRPQVITWKEFSRSSGESTDENMTTL